MSIVLVARMFRKEYETERLKPVTLSTSIADSGTVFSAIVPWNVNGAFFAGTMGVATLAYAPYAFLMYLSPLITVIIGFVYFRKDHLPSDDDATAVYGEEPNDLPTQKLMA